MTEVFILRYVMIGVRFLSVRVRGSLHFLYKKNIYQNAFRENQHSATVELRYQEISCVLITVNQLLI